MQQQGKIINAALYWLATLSKRPAPCNPPRNGPLIQTICDRRMSTAISYLTAAWANFFEQKPLSIFIVGCCRSQILQSVPSTVTMKGPVKNHCFVSKHRSHENPNRLPLDDATQTINNGASYHSQTKEIRLTEERRRSQDGLPGTMAEPGRILHAVQISLFPPSYLSGRQVQQIPSLPRDETDHRSTEAEAAY
jgi:hypothetical protein